MNTKALRTISYGLYIITSRKGEQINGQMANSVFQISSDPATIAVSINKDNLTNEFIKESKLYTVSVLAQDAPLSLIGNFGFKSGREIDKFKEVSYEFGSTGAPYLTDDILAYFEAEVIQVVDAVTHDIFIGKISGAEILKEGTPMTYAYYHKVKRGETPKTAPTFVEKENGDSNKLDNYVCSICSYAYDPEKGDAEAGIPPGTPFEKLPKDWVCPICGANKNKFKKKD